MAAATVIVELFLNANSPMQINTMEKRVMFVKQAIQNNDVALVQEGLEKVLSDAELVMIDTLSRFWRSTLYLQHTKELAAEVEAIKELSWTI